ncbi:MAG: MFS transporter [Rubrivivax sp.]
MAGNCLEFYDFMTYAYFAVYIGNAFFPASTEMGRLLASVAAFGVGFVTRPLGGILIGALADRAGRRPALLLTIVLITVGTMGLALTPSYESIGIWAPIIVVTARLIQGLGLGGEVGPASAFLIEIAPPGQRGLYGAWQVSSQGLAMLAAGLSGMLLTASLSPQEMQAWGWRVPFAVGLLLIPVALYLRRSMPETAEHGHGHHSPARSVGTEQPRLRHYTGLVVLSMLVILGGTVSVYVGGYMTTYAITTLKMSPTVSMAATLVLGLTTFVFAMIGGWASDRFNARSLMVWSRIVVAALAYPAFWLLVEMKTPAVLLLVTFVLAAPAMVGGAASIVGIAAAFPARIRATGIAVSYSIAVAVFGGSTQFLITWLVKTLDNPLAPAWYLTVASLITAVAMYFLPDNSGKPLAK